MPEEQIEQDEFGIPRKKRVETSVAPETDEFGIPIKKKDGISGPTTTATTTLPITSNKVSDYSVTPGAQSSVGGFSLKPKTEYNGFSLAPAAKSMIPTRLSLNQEGLVGSGQKKSSLYRAVDQELDYHMPISDTYQGAAVDPLVIEQKKKIHQAVADNNTPELVAVRDGAASTFETDLLKLQEDKRAKTFSGAQLGQPVPPEIKAIIDIDHDAKASYVKDRLDHSNNVWNEAIKNAVVQKHLNPVKAEDKAALQGFTFNKEISKPVYEQIGKDLAKYNVPNTTISTGNSSYDNIHEGLKAVIKNGEMEANDLIEQGKGNGSPSLLQAAQNKVKELDHHNNILDNLDDDYPDVQVQKTARFLGDIMQNLGYSKSLTISRDDVMKAAEEAEKVYPGFQKKYGKYVGQVADTEGSGFLGSMKSGLIPRSNLVGQFDQSLKSWLSARTGAVATAFGDYGLSNDLHAQAESPLLQGPSISGGNRTKLSFGHDGSFVEKNNEDYGKISWNNAVRSFSHAVPGLLEWIGAERAIGGVVAKAGEAIAGVSNAGKTVTELSSLGRYGEEAAAIGEGLNAADKIEGYSRLGGLVGASYITGYEGNRKMAEDLIDDKSGWGDAKKNAFAHLTTLLTAGVFHALGASPNKIMEQSLAKSVSKDVLSTLEKVDFKNVGVEELSALMNERMLPKAIRLTGQSLKEGTQMAAAADASNKLTQLASSIVNPSKVDFGTLEDNVTGFIGQALTMSMFPALGRIASKGGEVPYLAKDAIYDAAINDGVMIDNIHNKISTGEVDKNSGTMMVKLIRTMKQSVNDALFETNKQGLPLSTKQIKDWATADFRSKIGEFFKEQGKDTPTEAIHNETAQAKRDITNEIAHHPVEESEVFKSVTPVSAEVEKPTTVLDIEPGHKYNVTVDGEDKMVTGATLHDILTDAAVHEREEARISELEKKQNPVIEEGKVVKPGEALSASEQKEYDDLVEKRESFKGLRDDDFAKKYLTPEDYDKWHELDKNDEPLAKQIIADKKEELLSPKTKQDGNSEKTNEADETKIGQQDEVLKTEGVAPKEATPSPIVEPHTARPATEEILSTVKSEGDTYEGIFSIKESSVTNKGKNTRTPITEKEGWSITYMEPSKYLSLVKDGMTKNFSKILNKPQSEVSYEENINDNSQQAIKDAASKGEKVDMPFLEYDESGKLVDQDGRNRAFYAEQRGESKIPVMVKGKINETTQDTKQAEPLKIGLDEKQTSEVPVGAEEAITPVEGVDKEVAGSTEGEVKPTDKKESVEEPPGPPHISTPDNILPPEEEWSSVRNEKLKEIAGAEKLFEKQQRKGWNESYKNALDKVQSEYPAKNLYDAMKTKLNSWVERLDNSNDKLVSTSPDEDTAMLNVLRSQIDKRVNEIEGWDSDLDTQRYMAMAEWNGLQKDLFNVARVSQSIGTGVARGLVIRQAEILNSSEDGLKIRRMELLDSKGGERLSQDDLDFTAEQWDKEKQILQKEQELREKSMQEKFDKELERVRKEFGRSPKTTTERKAKLLSESGKELADKIRSGKITGLKSDPIGFSVAFNAALDVIALAVEKGATLAEAIKNYIDSNKIENHKEFEDNFVGTLDRQLGRQETFDKIKQFSVDNQLGDISNEMVGKNLIKNYVESFIGSEDQKDILNHATSDLKTIFPNLDSKRLTEAYLKEGEFKQLTKKQSDEAFQNSTRSLKNISKLQEDIEDLNGYKELRQRSFRTEREKTDYEMSLENDKKKIISDRAAFEEKNTKEYRALETERNRQQAKEADLKYKIESAKEIFIKKGDAYEKVPDTPEIERLKQELSDTRKMTAETEAAIIKNVKNAEAEQKRYAALEKELDRVSKRKPTEKSDGNNNTVEKNTSLREEEISKKIEEQKVEWKKEKEAASALSNDYKKLETERNRQLQRVADLNKKLDLLQQGVRDAKQAGEAKIDTPEIESLKEQVKKADKQLREVESAARELQRNADAKNKRISELNEDIDRMKNTGEFVRRNKSRSERQIDEDIARKEAELKRAMIEQGVKVSGEDKYTKASYDQRAESHNNRIDDMVTRMRDKLNDESLTTEQSKELRTLSDKLNASKVKLDPDSKLSQKNTLEGGLDVIKNIQSDFDKKTASDPDMAEYRRGLQKMLDGFERDKERTDQNIKLARTKDQLSNAKEEFRRKINAGEFEEKQPIELTKSDAELIKLQRDKDIIAGEYYKRQQKYRRDKSPMAWGLAETSRAAYVTTLIWKGVTLAKVASSAIVRPQLEAATKIMFGKPFEKVAPAIAAKAKEGGESQSIESIKKGYEAYFRQYSESDIQKKFEASTQQFSDADAEYRTAQSALNDVPDKDSKEYQNVSKEVAKLKNKRDNALVKNLSDSVFLYINGSSLKEFWQVLVHRSADIESTFGNFDREAWTPGFMDPQSAKQRLAIARDNFEYVMNFVGRSHSALKTLSGRQSFASSFMARLESAVKDGRDVSTPDRLLEIANESYLDWDRGKYQQTNKISDSWNDVVNYVEKKYPAISYLMKADVAITRVPVNQIWEALAEYTVGAFTSTYDAGKAYYKSRKITIADGYTPSQAAEFKQQVAKNVSESITPKQAATILRSFRKGGFGLGVYALALMSGVQFGGFSHRGQTADDKRLQKREDETGIPEVKTGKIKVGDQDIPEVWAKIAEHTPALYPALFGMGLAKVYENNIKEGKSTPESAINSAAAHVDNILNSIPQYKVFSPMIKDVAYSVKSKATQLDDIDQDGNKIKRKVYRPGDFLDVLLGKEKELLSPDNYKDAVRVNSDYEEDVAAVNANANLTKEEKNGRIKELGAVKERDIDLIYERNKKYPE